MPSNPECSTIQKKVVNRTSTNILLQIIKSNSTDKKLCIKSQRNESMCTPTSQYVPFGGLKPSTTYKFLLFSYIDESEYSSVQLRSRSNCSFWVHTRESLLYLFYLSLFSSPYILKVFLFPFAFCFA